MASVRILLFLRGAVLAAALAPHLALAQQDVPATLRPGSPVRLTLAGSELPLHALGNGQIILLAADTASLVVSGLTRAKLDTIPYQALRQIEVRDGAYSRLTVMLAGALGGAFIGYVAQPRPHLAGGGGSGNHRRDVLVYTASGAAIGAALGVALPRDRWRTVEPPLRAAADSTTVP